MPSIAIVGAGPAGLTLARLLLVKCRAEIVALDMTIFEKDESAHARLFQGGTLDLHTKTGLAALKAAQMWDDILPHFRYDSQEIMFADQNYTKTIHLKNYDKLGPVTEYERPEIDREILKDHLLKAVQEIGGAESVTWGKALARVDDETGVLDFRDGTKAGPFDLVIGADGAWSKIRNVVVTSDVKPKYSGICGFESQITSGSAGDDWDEITRIVGSGNCFCFSGGRALMAQRVADGSVKMAFWVTKEPSWPEDIQQRYGGDEDKMRQALFNEYIQWDDSFKLLIKSSFQYRPWPLYELPVGHSWEHVKGFTLIGDSAHLMTPFAGEGVNLAMTDALELSQRLFLALKTNSSLDEAVREYEQDMFPRNARVQGLTARNKDLMFRRDAPVGFSAGTLDMAMQELGYDSTKGLLSWAVIPFRLALYCYFWSVIQVGHVKRYMKGPSRIVLE